MTKRRKVYGDSTPAEWHEENPEFVRPSRAMRLLGIDAEGLTRLQNERELHAVDVNGVWAFRRGDIERLNVRFGQGRA